MATIQLSDDNDDEFIFTLSLEERRALAVFLGHTSRDELVEKLKDLKWVDLMHHITDVISFP